MLSLSNPLNIKQTFILIRYLPTRIIVATYKEDIAVIVILPELVKNPTTGCKAAGICVYYLMLLAKHPAGTSAIFPPFPVDLCTDLLYTVCSEHEMQFNSHLQHGSEPAADGVLTMLTIKRKQNRS